MLGNQTAQCSSVLHCEVTTRPRRELRWLVGAVHKGVFTSSSSLKCVLLCGCVILSLSFHIFHHGRRDSQLGMQIADAFHIFTSLFTCVREASC